MDSLFPLAPFTRAAAKKARTVPDVRPVKYAGGYCNAACMFALGPDCDCPCLGRNHQRGLQCDGFTQEDMAL